MLSREWRCSWSSADRRCSNYIWVINSFIAYQGATYIRGLMVWLIVAWWRHLAIWSVSVPNMPLPEPMLTIYQPSPNWPYRIKRLWNLNQIIIYRKKFGNVDKILFWWPQQDLNRKFLVGFHYFGWSFIEHTAVWCCYKVVEFLPNPLKRHPIAHPWGWGMGCLLCMLGVQSLMFCLSYLIAECDIMSLEHVMNAPDCLPNSAAVVSWNLKLHLPV